MILSRTIYRSAFQMSMVAAGLLLMGVLCLGYGTSTAAGQSGGQPGGEPSPQPNPSNPPTNPQPQPSPSPNEDMQRAVAETKLAVARYEKDKDIAAAKAAFQKVRGIDPNYPLPLYYLGRLAEMEENWDEAIADYEALAKLDDHSDYYVKSQLRLDDVRKFAKMDKTPEGKRNRKFNAALLAASQALAAGRPNEAASLAQQAAQIDPSRYEAPALQATIMAKLNQPKSALDYLNKALPLAPDDKKPAIQAMILQAQALLGSGINPSQGSQAASVNAGGTNVPAATSADQDVNDAEQHLADLNGKIDDALKEYQPTSRHVAALRKARDDYYQKVAPHLLELLVARQAELEALTKEMLPTSAPVQAKQAQVDRLRELCKPSLVAQLLGTAKAQVASGSLDSAQKTLQGLFALDPNNSDGQTLMESIKNESTASAFATGKPFDNTVGMHLVPIQPGQFTMGSPEGEEGRFDDETPHKVTLTKGFYMGATPVTQAQWQAVMGNNPSGFKGDNLPVEHVSWDDAVGYCQKLSQKEGKHYRLPTEAEWEYACRAGTTGAYGGTGNLDDMGWYDGNSGQTTHPVGTKQANAWGLYDMHGNVWQWCSDWYGDYPAGDLTDPTGLANGGSRVFRGGSWVSEPRVCRSASRDCAAPGYRYDDVGFRVVQDLSE